MEKVIFVVDDSVTNLVATEAALGKHHTVMTIPTGKKAISLLEKVKPDLILLDIEMPEMDGFQVLEYLKSDGRFADIPVIFLTAMHDARTEIKALEMGVADFMTKPFSEPVLLNRIRLHIQMYEILQERTAQLSRSRRKEMEANELAAILLDTSPMLIAIWDDQFNIIDCNRQILDMFGLRNKEEFVARFNEFSPPFQPCGASSIEKHTRLLQYVMETGFDRHEWMSVLPSGELLPLEMICTRVERDGRYIIVKYLHDLRPLKETAKLERELEAQLLEAEINERARLMFDSTPLVIEYWDRDFNPMDCNKTALTHYGFADKDEYRRKLFSLSVSVQADGSSSRARWNSHLEEIFETGQCKFEFSEILNGSLSFQEVDGIRMMYHGAIIAVTYTKDVTVLKQMQQERRRIEIAEESNNAKSRFLARMSHEVRTPIAAVLGISEIQLQSPDLSPVVEEAFAKIYDSSQILLGIVNDILDLSKIEANKMELLCEEYEIASLVGDAVQPHIVSVGEKDIEFHLYIDEQLPQTLLGDALRIKQIINNIASNAFKYTERGSVDLSLLRRNCVTGSPAEHDIMLEISIRDTGLGMTDEQIATLYNEYTRFHESEPRFVTGTGLGMAIVCNLVSMMDASINVSSKPGKGTHVTVSIPQKIGNPQILGKEMAKSLQRFELNAQSAKKRFKFVPEPMPYGRVLVVDDISANLYVAQGLLGFYDLHVDTCDSGYAALEKIDSGNVYDIVFMDYMMPGLNGTETMHLMRERGYTAPIVALTANALIGQAEEFIRSGFDGFISKPIQTVHLNTLLVRYIKDKHPIEAAQAAVSRATRRTQNINSFRHDAELQQKLQSDFVRSQKDAVADIRKAAEAGDTETAHRLAHSLKGLAALIHEDRLSQAAQGVEQSFDDGVSPSAESLSALHHELTIVLEKIASRQLRHDLNRAAPSSTADPTQLFDKLLPLLESRSSGCQDMLDDLRGIPETAVLVHQIETFNFSAALKTLIALRDILHIKRALT
ncbi:MAG: response regulator [Defluviitaleaceae bacterium]|nr:response regulator [Defluviitaleaceae bacterium]